MAVRQSEAEWKGSLKEGTGRMRLGSGVFEGAYSFVSRFESGTGTNPEELIGAAHAGCFSMALSAGLGKAGLTPTRIHTVATVHLAPLTPAPPSRRSISPSRAKCPGSTPPASSSMPTPPRKPASSRARSQASRPSR